MKIYPNRDQNRSTGAELQTLNSAIWKAARQTNRVTMSRLVVLVAYRAMTHPASPSSIAIVAIIIGGEKHNRVGWRNSLNIYLSIRIIQVASKDDYSPRRWAMVRTLAT